MLYITCCNGCACRCMPCPGNTATADVITGIPTSSGYTDISDCQPLPGKGFFPDGVVQPCPVGYWSAGLQQRTCKPCSAAHTTLSEGSNSPKDCVVQPGWAMAGSGLPQPCAKGFYGPGGMRVMPTACALSALQAGRRLKALRTVPATAEVRCSAVWCCAGCGDACVRSRTCSRLIKHRCICAESFYT